MSAHTHQCPVCLPLAVWALLGTRTENTICYFISPLRKASGTLRFSLLNEAFLELHLVCQGNKIRLSLIIKSEWLQVTVKALSYERGRRNYVSDTYYFLHLRFSFLSFICLFISFVLRSEHHSALVTAKREDSCCKSTIWSPWPPSFISHSMNSYSCIYIWAPSMSQALVLAPEWKAREVWVTVLIEPMLSFTSQLKYNHLLQQAIFVCLVKNTDPLSFTFVHICYCICQVTIQLICFLLCHI